MDRLIFTEQLSKWPQISFSMIDICSHARGHDVYAVAPHPAGTARLFLAHLRSVNEANALKDALSEWLPQSPPRAP